MAVPVQKLQAGWPNDLLYRCSAVTEDAIKTRAGGVTTVEEKIKVLVIDDEPSVAEALRLILNDHGYETAVARTGRDGLELAGRQQFDITITDLRLPDMSGLDILSAICQKNPMSLVVIITAHSTPEMIVEARSCGAVDVLPKPFLPSDILGLITAALTGVRSHSPAGGCEPS